MDVLVLGGTLFLGRHIVEAALARGWRVTLFTRGVTDPSLYPQAEHVRGDRDGGLGPLRGRRFDAAFDTCGYVPRIVRQSAQLLADVPHYCFVSSMSVYAGLEPGRREDAPLCDPPLPEVEDIQEHYGALKVGCERELERVFGERALLARAGLIVGPHDRMNRFPYWVNRLTEGGRCLGPGEPTQPVQWIDARDLAAWLLDSAEAGRGGPYNLAGPERPATVGELLSRMNAALGGRAELVWPGGDFLARHEVAPLDGLPLWAPPDLAGFFRTDLGKPLGAGLRLRPIEETARDTLATMQADGFTTEGKIGVQVESGLPREREQALLDLLSQEAGPATADT